MIGTCSAKQDRLNMQTLKRETREDLDARTEMLELKNQTLQGPYVGKEYIESVASNHTLFERARSWCGKPAVQHQRPTPS